MGLIDRKRKDTSLMTIALSVMGTNIFGTFKLAVEVTRKKMRSQAKESRIKPPGTTNLKIGFVKQTLNRSACQNNFL